jgi:hypothetical protein
LGKRSSGQFERRERDLYITPLAAVAPLIPHLQCAEVTRFAEPCAGNGDLVRHLESRGLVCTYAGDISTGQDALEISSFDGVPVITNPPWSRAVLHGLIAHFMRAAPFTWLLFDADWAHTKQSRDLVRHCSHILPIGRVKWIAGSKDTGKDNAAWYRFEQSHAGGPIQLAFRATSAPSDQHAIAAELIQRSNAFLERYGLEASARLYGIPWRPAGGAEVPPPWRRFTSPHAAESETPPALESRVAAPLPPPPPRPSPSPNPKPRGAPPLRQGNLFSEDRP